jgi:hypothetical protein
MGGSPRFGLTTRNISAGRYMNETLGHASDAGALQLGRDVAHQAMVRVSRSAIGAPCHHYVGAQTLDLLRWLRESDISVDRRDSQLSVERRGAPFCAPGPRGYRASRRALTRSPTDSRASILNRYARSRMMCTSRGVGGRALGFVIGMRSPTASSADSAPIESAGSREDEPCVRLRDGVMRTEPGCHTARIEDGLVDRQRWSPAA